MTARNSKATRAPRGRAGSLRAAVARRAVVAVSSFAIAGALFLVPASLPAAAEPLTVDEAKAQVTQLEVEAAAIDQEYVGVKERLALGRKKLATKKSDVAAQTAKVAQMRVQVGQVALAQFQNQNIDTTAQLFLTEETDEFLSQISTVEKVNQNQNTVLQDFQAQQAKLADLERSAQTDVAKLKEQEAELTALRAASEEKIAESKAVLARLTAEERKRLADEERRVAEAARKAGEAAQAQYASQPGSAKKKSGGSATKTASSTGKGSAVVAFARAQLGKPYQFAGNGPGSYDCSGLTSAAWRAAGVSLPRTSQSQLGVGRSVSRSQLRPGDLLFFYDDISHVAIYVGGDTIIQSPRPGRTVEFASMSDMPFAGARRPG